MVPVKGPTLRNHLVYFAQVLDCENCSLILADNLAGYVERDGRRNHLSAQRPLACNSGRVEVIACTVCCWPSR
jgi:hypothetical protein